jgi:predicted kinase
MAEGRPFILILVGIPGSGKSQFASELESKSRKKFVRINQDVLGDRRACEDLARRVLATGKIAVIDRCNFDRDQRVTWTKIAYEMRVQCDCIVFTHSREDCIRRCQKRIGHESIRPHEAVNVVTRMANNFRPPIPLRDVSSSRSRGYVQCSGGERFRRLEFISTFEQADALADWYLRGYSRY